MKGSGSTFDYMTHQLIGIDIGTQGTKSAGFTEELQPLGLAFEASRLITPKEGVVWQDPDDIYSSVIRTLKQLNENPNIDFSKVAAIGISGQMAGIMGIDQYGEASTPYDSWLDTRCEPYALEMNKLAGNRITRISGGPASYVHGPKILWWKNEQAGQYESTRAFVLPHAYVAGKLCGNNADKAYFDHTCLHFSCLSNNADKAWSDELIELFDIDANKMPTIVSPFTIVGYITSAVSKETGLVAGTPVVAGAGDTAASTFGAGMIQPGMLLDVAGTAQILSGVTNEFRPDFEYETLVTMRSPLDDIFLPLSYVNGGGLYLRWIRDSFCKQGESYDELEKEASAIPVGSRGLIASPHLSGRVLPFSPHLRGGLWGLESSHERGHVFRSVMEAIACEYAIYLERMRSLYPELHFNELRSVGGASKSKLFNQIKADVLDVDVVTYEMGETGIIGSAAIAGMGIGLDQDYTRIVADISIAQDITRPNQKAHEEYQQVIDRYKSFMKRIERDADENII